MAEEASGVKRAGQFATRHQVIVFLLSWLNLGPVNWVFASFLALSSFAAASALAEVTPTALVPAGPWQIDYADLSCNLNRTMTAGGAPYSLSFGVDPLDSPIILTIKNEERVKRRVDGDATIYANGVAQAAPAYSSFYQAKDKRATRSYLLNFAQHALGTVDTRLRVTTKFSGDFDLQLTGFKSALVALGRCKSDLHRSLGMDPAALKLIAVHPKGEVANFLDRPRLYDDESLRLHLLYWVTKGGKVEQCRQLSPSGFKSLDEKICPMLEAKAIMTPAKQADGQSVRAPVYMNVYIRTVMLSQRL